MEIPPSNTVLCKSCRCENANFNEGKALIWSGKPRQTLAWGEYGPAQVERSPSFKPRRTRELSSIGAELIHPPLSQRGRAVEENNRKAIIREHLDMSLSGLTGATLPSCRGQDGVQPSMAGGASANPNYQGIVATSIFSQGLWPGLFSCLQRGK